MSLRTLHLADFRLFEAAELTPDPEGTTVISGDNGAGKTSLLEAVAYLGTQRSFRGAPREALVRRGAERAVVRAELVRGGNPLVVETEIVPGGRSRSQVNRQAVRGRRDLAEAVPVSVFSPQDLAIVQGGPAGRRALLDDALRIVDHKAGTLLDDLERILRQRAALLRQSGGRLSADVEASLDVWDARMSDVGTEVAQARYELTEALAEHVAQEYRALAGAQSPNPRDVGGDVGAVSLDYRRGWDGALADALIGARREDLRRGVSTVGPQRDELELRIDRRDARTQASQGEQRTLALALRLATHALVASHVGAPPILLLDDVFSELDLHRSQALVRELPAGQSLLTTAVPLPPGVEVAQVVTVGPGGTIVGHRGS